MRERIEHAVIGGGVMGLATAAELARGGARVVLLEQHAIGSERGSSHGPSRVARATYPDAIFARLMETARAEDWPRLEREAQARLLHPSVGCFYGAAGGSFDGYVATMESSGAQVEIVDAAEARRRFPMLAFPDTERVIVDPAAGVIAAADTVAALARLARARGAELVEGARVAAIERDGDTLGLALESGERLDVASLVVTAGPWTARLVPELRGALRVLRQTVAYLEAPATLRSTEIGDFPIWASLGRGDDLFYGLPSFGRAGLKIARHELVGRRDDPDAPPGRTSGAVLARLRHGLARQLGAAPGALLGAETCLYTATASEDFVMDVHPEDPRIVIGAGFSGHGFKFAPLVGRILAGLVRDGRSDVEAFEASRARFALGTRGRA